jgi:hypothetical protein
VADPQMTQSSSQLEPSQDPDDFFLTTDSQVFRQLSGQKI